MSHEKLMEAIESGQGEAALRLLEADPRLCTESDEPSTLMLALYRAQTPVAQAIADRRKDLTVFEAAAIGDEESLAARLTDPDVARAVASDGFAPLHLASFFGREGAVRQLLDAGADPDALAEGPGLRPLHSAAAARSLPIVRFLLGAGADPNVRQHGGYAPLHAAAMHGDEDMVAAMLKAGADPLLVDDQGRAAADFAREEGHTALAGKLAALSPAT